MTKAELIKALEPFPDDIELKCHNNGLYIFDVESLTLVSPSGPAPQFIVINIS